MMLYVFANHFCGYLVAYRAGEIAVFPELPTPQLPFHLWVLPKDGSRTQTLEPRYHLRYRIVWGERTENMYVVKTYLHLFDGNVVLFGNLCKHLTHPLGNRTLQKFLAILGRAYQMVRGVIGGVSCASENHVRIVANPGHLGSGIEPPAKMVHPSPPQAAGPFEPVSP